MSAIVQFTVFVISLVTYLATEKTYLHVSRTLRRTFWALIAVSFTGWLLALLHAIESFSSWLVLLAVAMASSLEDSYTHKRSLTPLTVQHAPEHQMEGGPEAEGKAELVGDLVRSLGRWYGETFGLHQVLTRIRGVLSRRRRQLRDALGNTTAAELNYILASVNCAALLDVAGPEILDMLTHPKKRLPHLNVLSRAAVVDGLQKVGMRHQPHRQSAAAQVILGTEGLALTQLKSYLDDGGEYHTTYKLVYSDLQGSSQAAVAMHIANQGAALRDHFQRALPEGPPGIMLKIISDIDDTLMCSGGRYPAGIDTRLPRKCLYPGVLAFYNELDRGQVERCQAALSALQADADGHPGSPRHLSALRHGRAAVSEAQQLYTHATGAMMFKQPQPSQQEAAEWPTPDWAGSRAPSFESTRAAEAAPPHARCGDHGAEAMRNGGGLGSALGHHWMGWASSALQCGVNLAFLSARPESYKGFTEADSYRRIFAPLLASGGLKYAPMLLLGDMSSAPTAVVRYMRRSIMPARGKQQLLSRPQFHAGLNSHLYEVLAQRKLSRYLEYTAIYPECYFVFIGDSGQGDVLCAEWCAHALESLAAEQLVGSFIHLVDRPCCTLSSANTGAEADEELLHCWREEYGIHCSRTYPGLAHAAHRAGLISAQGLHRVAHAACNDMRRILARYRPQYPWRRWYRIVESLNADVAAANEVLPPMLQVSPVVMPEEQ